MLSIDLEVSDDTDAGILSSDLNNVQLWCQKWGLELNHSKCTAVHFLQKPWQQQHTYKVNGINVKTSDVVKYLGITLTVDISWGKHILNICGTALKKLGFIKRVEGRYSDKKVKETCDFGLVRPHLKYAASIWDPGHKDLIRKLNQLQRKAGRFVKNRYERTQSATQLILELDWEQLETRRLHASLGLLEEFRWDLFQSDAAEIILAPHYIERYIAEQMDTWTHSFHSQ
jgi:hypothetical protein